MRSVYITFMNAQMYALKINVIAIINLAIYPSIYLLISYDSLQARNRIKRDTSRLISQHYGQGNNNATEMLIDRIQRNLECCGATTPDDWINSNYNGGGIERGVTGSTFYKLPHSCCNTAILTNPQMCAAKVDNIPRHESLGSESIYKEGCLKKLEDWITNKWPWIVITGGILIGVQLFALIFACVLCCAISRVGDK